MGERVTRDYARASVEYCVLVGTKCVYEAANEQFDEGETEKTIMVEAAYSSSLRRSLPNA
jgi:hypothetical protein